MFEKQKAEKNFIQKKREWKGDFDKPMGKRTLIMMLPALFIGVFMLLSAPYMKIIAEKILIEDKDIDLRELNIAEEPEKVEVEEALPPPNPDANMALFYQKKFDEEGFDWRKSPEAPAVDMEFAKEKPIVIAPVGVDLPITMSGLETDGE